MHIRYRFTQPDGVERTFDVTLAPDTLALIPRADAAEPPAWTALDNHQCPNCPLAPAPGARCPVAVNVDPVIQSFHDAISYEVAEIFVETDARTYTKRAPLQQGISGLIGLIMVTSGCPVLDRLRPMVRNHVPFATLEETTYRAMAMYMLSQFFVKRQGGEPDWDMRGLTAVYAEVRKVNKAFVPRLRTLQIEDASLNAVVNLDVFASFTSMSIASDTLDEVEALFSAYLGETSASGRTLSPSPTPSPVPTPDVAVDRRTPPPPPTRSRSPIEALGRHLIWEPERDDPTPDDQPPT